MVPTNLTDDELAVVTAYRNLKAAKAARDKAHAESATKSVEAASKQAAVDKANDALRKLLR